MVGGGGDVGASRPAPDPQLEQWLPAALQLPQSRQVPIGTLP